MAITTEKRLAKLEQDVQDLKATYAVYGGLMRTYATQGEWSITTLTTNLRIKFTPNYLIANKTIISSVYYKVVEEGQELSFDDFYLSIQDGTGSVVMNFGTIFENSVVYVRITSSVPGSLTRL